MKKICSSCREERDAEKDFRWKYKDQGIRQTRCRCCQAKLAKIHYENNKQTYIERARVRKARMLIENRPRLHDYLSTHPCVDCGQSDIRGHKTANIARLLTQGRSWSVIEVEIAKCEIRCVNCHRKRTSERDGDWWKASEVE